MNERAYFLHDGQTQQGPYSLEQLRDIGIKPEHLIWHEDLESWTPAPSIAELIPFLKKKTPPPLDASKFTAKPEAPKPDPPSHSKPDQRPITNRHAVEESIPQKKSRFGAVMRTLAILILLLAGGAYIIQKNSGNDYAGG